MKYIKKLNINFNNWDEIITGYSLSDIINKLKVNDRINVSFTKNEITYKNIWGVIKYKDNNNNEICIEFDKNIKGHNGYEKCHGKLEHCWYFSTYSHYGSYNLYIYNIIKN